MNVRYKLYYPLEKISSYDVRRHRERMVKEQIIARGIQNTMVLNAMNSVPRHLFVPEALQARAYGDHPLPIGFGQTISQPYIVAYMSSLIKPEIGLSVLEIGTGCGYQTTILAEMGLEVFTIERVRELYFPTKNLFQSFGYRKIRTKLADGTLGWKENAPFDRIIVTAGGPDIPKPLIDQLGDPGIMVIPVGKSTHDQKLICVIKEQGVVRTESVVSVAFVDLIGDYGW